MHLSDLDNAVKANRIIDRIDRALKQIDDAKQCSPDVGGIRGVAQYGYSAVLSEHNDGSGKRVDMSGCYVANEVIESTRKILMDKREEVLGYLETIGVNTDDA